LQLTNCSGYVTFNSFSIKSPVYAVGAGANFSLSDIAKNTNNTGQLNVSTTFQFVCLLLRRASI
jgi:hypothetical protein